MSVLTLSDIKPVSDPVVFMACVIGHPIGHSKSPDIHSGWIAQNNLQGHYHALDVAPDDLGMAITRLQECGYRGCNVTIPHKQAVMDFCDEITPVAQKIGAVNTVVFCDGKIIGTNTDAYGFIENFKAQHPNYDLSGKPALVIGAGGASRAIVYALMQENVSSIRIVNRSFDRAQKLTDDFGNPCQAIAWEGRSLAVEGAGLIVNTTSLGMEGYPALDLDLTNLLYNTPVYDIVYTPLMTDLLKRTEIRGNPYITGYGMLLYQAQLAFKEFFGVLPAVGGGV